MLRAPERESDGKEVSNFSTKQTERSGISPRSGRVKKKISGRVGGRGRVRPNHVPSATSERLHPTSDGRVPSTIPAPPPGLDASLLPEGYPSHVSQRPCAVRDRRE